MYLHNLFSYKINEQITRLHPRFDNMTGESGFMIVNDIFKQLRAQKIQLIFDYNLQVPVQGKEKVGNEKYAPYYRRSARPVQI